MAEKWQPSAKHLKQYSHFDAPISLQEVAEIANNPSRVASNAYFPFLQYKKSWIPFRVTGFSDPKERLIRYASRRDSAIFARYRELLAVPYEYRLAALGLKDSVIAYRRIPVKPGSRRGKCNIHFAKDAFDEIKKIGNCCAVVMDISKYFENIDHLLLKEKWCDLIEVDRLPDDHFLVYKAITAYSWVDLKRAMIRLGYADEQGQVKRGVKIPIQLCSPQDFRLKIAGHDPNYSNLIERNPHAHGIPQGAPLSDVLANLYLLDFDLSVWRWVTSAGGVYRRYSDDILVLVPGGFEAGQAAREFISTEIKQHGDNLVIKPEKTSIVAYQKQGEVLYCDSLDDGKGRNGLEYLGFRFDGKRVFLRDSTVSRFFRKMKFYCRREVVALIKRYPGKSLDFMTTKFNFYAFESRYGRVEDFDSSDVKKWTFWTYARRASEIFGAEGKPIINQIRRYRDFIRRAITKEMVRQHSQKKPVTVDGGSKPVCVTAD